MPSYDQPYTLNDTDKETVLALCYEAMKQLGWHILFAGDYILGASSPRDWGSKGQQIVCMVQGDLLIMRSEMVNGEMIDIGGKNKKNTDMLMSAYEAAKMSTGTAVIEANKKEIRLLRQQTILSGKQHQLATEEIARALNPEGSKLFITYVLISINVLVFALMALDGAGIMAANGWVHIKWGSNFKQLTQSGDWWRLLTNTFIHFGIIHLAMNMYCLYIVGVYLEPMLGRVKYIAAYLCTGILASLASLWWHKEGVNSAGASGAIFGLYGLFLALLTSKFIPQKVRERLLQSIVIFIGFNLVAGMKSGVDNAAHVGGLLSGFAIGYGHIYTIKKEQQQNEKIKWLVPVMVVFTIFITAAYLWQNQTPYAERAALLKEINEVYLKDK